MKPVMSCAILKAHNKTEDRELHLSKTGNRSNFMKSAVCFYQDFDLDADY